MDMMAELGKQIEEQLQVVPEVRYVPELDPDGALKGIRAFTFENVPLKDKRTKVFGYFGLPEGASEMNRVPAILLIHGGLGHAYAAWVKQWNDRGFAAIACDTTGFFPAEKNAGDREGYGDNDRWKRELGGVFAEEGFTVGPDNDDMKSAGLPYGEQWMYHALCMSIRAHTILRQHPFVDASRVGVTGISWGGVITSLLLGYDPRFAFAIPVYGSGYLGEGFGFVCELFKKPEVRELWLAEKRFNRLKLPVFWIAWNSDTPFSVHSPSLSYRAVRASCPGSRIYLKNDMQHSHTHGWSPKEIAAFARTQIGKAPAFPELTLRRTGDCVQVGVSAEDGVVPENAVLYYLCEKEWKTVPCKRTEKTYTVTLPKEAAGYYVEVSFRISGETFCESTDYEEVFKNADEG